MNILVTGAHGFVGKNLIEALKNIRDGKDRTRAIGVVQTILEYDLDTDPSLLPAYCAQADFVFHLAGVNRPKEEAEFMAGNFGFTSQLLDALKAANRSCPIMISSSIQAALDNPYGRSKRAGEQLLRDYSAQTGARVLIYRFPNLFGKWCRPNYNSAVATFCHNMANDLPITVNDPTTVLQLAYIDDVVDELLRALTGNENRDGDFCAVPTIHRVSLGEIVRLLEAFRMQPQTLQMPALPDGSFEKKLYSTYLSYLPKEKVAFPLHMNVDHRGSFTELLRTGSCGQFSVNISEPGITKGQHWHNSKWELFIVVSGHGLIQQRKVGTDTVLEFEVSGDCIQAVHMLPGYTHNIINLSKTQKLITLMWANEAFDPAHPDTYYETV